MDRQEAKHILDVVACRCDGYGVIPGPTGIAIRCPDCEGEYVTNDQIKEARKAMRGTSGYATHSSDEAAK